MGRNVEIKARVDNLETLDFRVKSLADEGPYIIDQEDTFFHCRTGRLKLREFSADRGELIFYERPDRTDPRTSHYQIVPTAVPQALRLALAEALGIIGVVRKRRCLYLVGQTRVHLDKVTGLGEFVELEVVLADNQTETVGRRTAEELMKALQIPAASLLDRAYIDLLLEKSG